ncbi:helix-turn-helix domain-containing protein [Oceanospirillum sediminis]|uniref:Helix-turn-helix domain-containing protein n=1 Tax=Oceanospirillum sediminis TaxID=2760088 RepID=A0A839IYH1_9GAMM|nr:helix-turn-helix domain-containing protein [Oceanospirillum sediminis]MBB1489479.1 helix-turn-helix domain-containing protein [Oceanospirillum sediminis]
MTTPIGKLMPLKEWQAERFAGQGPTLCTIRRWCQNGQLPARKIGSQWFIDLEAESQQTPDTPTN